MAVTSYPKVLLQLMWFKMGPIILVQLYHSIVVKNPIYCDFCVKNQMHTGQEITVLKFPWQH